MTDNIESSENSTASTPIRMSTYEGLGPDIVVSSPSTPRRSIYQQSPAAIKKQLQDQLNEKANQIQMTAELGQALVKQQTELEQRIRELDQTQGDEVPQELKDKLAELEKQANALEANTAKVFLGTRGLTSGGMDLTGSTGSPGPSATSIADSTPTTTSGRPSRRELNKAKKRKDDIELATEIGQGLLVEIRRLQALLQEKEEKIKELEIEKTDLERTIDLLNKQIRGKEESEERYKDENWNLELMKQDMSAQLEDLQQQLAKARNDYSKIEKALAAATDVIEQLKDKEERLTTEYYNLKTRHDQDMANNRRHVAALNREKNDLLKSLEDLRSQLASLQATRNIRKRTPEPGDDDELGQSISDNDTSNEGIPTALQGKNLNKEETLKALGIAKDMIGSLRANLQKEKSEKYELKKLLADSQEQIEAMRETEFDPAAVYNKKPKRSKRSNRASSASNGLPNIDENDSQDEIEDSGDDDMVINKDNRPSSDMFRPHGWKPDHLRKSRNSARSSIMSSRIDEDIPGDEFEVEEDDEIVAAQRAEALNNLTKPKRSPSRLSKQSLVEDPESFDLTGDAKSPKSRDSVVRKRVTEYEDFVQRKNNKDKVINPETGEEEEIKDDGSSVDSFTSANETNLDSKRGSATSKRNSKRASNRESSMPLSSDSLTKIISEEISPPKEFKDVAVQTEAERSDSLSTIHTGKFTFGNRDTVYDALRDSKDIPNTRQSVVSAHEDNNIDNRFTLDLSSGHRKNLPNQRGLSDPPPRPTNSPPPSLIHRPTVNFGQQAGSPKIPHHPLNVGRKGSTDSQDNVQINNAIGSRSIGNGTIPTSNHKHTLSSGSVSSVSSTSTSAEQIGRSDSSHVEAGSSTGPSTGPMTGPSGTDPNIIHAITQTMIGEYLWKYTRKNFGAGISEKRHKRFFWVHPYTKTLYWGSRDPGSYEPVDPKSKSGMSYFAYIESVRQVVDNNPSPPGLHHMSLVIKTPERELKFTARSKERHEYWFQALSYLLQRPDEVGQIGQGQTPGRITKNGSDPWENQANMQNLHNNTSPNGSLKGSNLREIKKKSSFSKIQAMFRRDGSSSSPTSPLSTEFVDGQHQQFAIPGPSNSNIDDDNDDLENVRQCCDGRHDVSKLERAPHKHHHHNHNHY